MMTDNYAEALRRIGLLRFRKFLIFGNANH
jgi:hypothetical protein